MWEETIVICVVIGFFAVMNAWQSEIDRAIKKEILAELKKMNK